MVLILFGRGKINFSEMEKFQRWIVRTDLEWTWHVDVFSLLNVQLSLIRPLVKEFMQAIIWFNSKTVKSIVQGVPIFITEKTMVEMLKLPILEFIYFRNNSQHSAITMQIKTTTIKCDRGETKSGFVCFRLANNFGTCDDLMLLQETNVVLVTNINQ